MADQPSPLLAKANAWFPVLQSYGTFIVGLAGVIVQIVIFTITSFTIRDASGQPHPILVPWLLGVCGGLCTSPDRLIPIAIKAIPWPSWLRKG